MLRATAVTDVSPDPQTLTAAEANRRFYAEIAEAYDDTELDARIRRRLRDTLADALGELPHAPRVLDACGGSGNASLILLEAGIRPLTVDVSPEMLAVYERKARASGYEPETCVSDIETFMATDRREWDLIVFSSALHHLEDYGHVLDLALARLAPGGRLVTIFDPTRLGRAGEWVRRFDYVAHVFFTAPGRVPALVARRLGRRPADDGSPSIGDRAERHALRGIDDLALRARFEAGGFEVLAHRRLYDGRFAATRLAHKVLRTPSSFSFVVGRPRGGVSA